jgi:hypothetical protein
VARLAFFILEGVMMEWKLADAKNRFSEVMSLALTQGAQGIRRRSESVIILSNRNIPSLEAHRQNLKIIYYQRQIFLELI